LSRLRVVGSYLTRFISYLLVPLFPKLTTISKQKACQLCALECKYLYYK
jgi:hypothetical protein